MSSVFMLVLIDAVACLSGLKRRTASKETTKDRQAVHLDGPFVTDTAEMDEEKHGEHTTCCMWSACKWPGTWTSIQAAYSAGIHPHLSSRRLLSVAGIATAIICLELGLFW